MLFKLLKNKISGEVTIGVLFKDKWVPLKPLMDFCKREEQIKCTNIASTTDIILLLADWKKATEDIRNLLEYAGAASLPYDEYQGGLIPFMPKSYRDFSLWEQHNINSAKGFAREFMPGLVGIVKFYEWLTRKPLPALKPKKIWYKKPIYYMGNHMSFQPESSTVQWPSYSNYIDYELELGVLITKHIYNASPQEAKEAIGGFLIFNDCSARDVQIPEMQGGFGPAKSKHFANVISDVVATPDEIFPYLGEMESRVYINDEHIATGKLSGMYHPIEEAVAYASLGEHVYPGEFMGSGTVANCSGIESGRPLKSGDVLRFEIDKIGSMTVRVTKN